MTHKEHCGWYNYETWAIDLWIDNDEGSQDYWRDQVQTILSESKPDKESNSTREQVAVHTLADQLKEWHEEQLPELSGFASDLLNGAMSEVNWREIAQHMIRDVIEDMEAP